MAFSSSQRDQFSRRNVAFGEEGAEKRRKQLAGYAEILQGLKNQGYLDALTSEHEFKRPEQEARIGKFGAEAEGLGIENEGQRFYQGLTKEFGPSFMRQSLGWPEPEGRANVSFPERESSTPALPGLSPKSSISATRPAGSNVPASPTGSGGLPGAWDRSTRTPIGRMFDLENITNALKNTWKGLDYIGEGMEKGVGRGFKYLFTPRRRRKEDETAMVR